MLSFPHIIAQYRHQAAIRSSFRNVTKHEIVFVFELSSKMIRKQNSQMSKKSARFIYN
jgi:hypothetical protein